MSEEMRDEKAESVHGCRGQLRVAKGVCKYVSLMEVRRTTGLRQCGSVERMPSDVERSEEYSGSTHLG